ncbi:6-bladed beta-propeller [Membranihabitans maritimus]|uniref:6-bladed beta-propeller n=1 Tax=Membranihabitans maritimus TaxID=2904244 RepID=UPI001F3639B6|nr:6-bladed beta-propeller [Membranihabitans maritimus]
MKTHLTPIFFLLLIFSCAEEKPPEYGQAVKNPLKTLDIEIAIQDTSRVLASDYFSEMRAVPLENKIPMKGAGLVKICNNTLIAKDRDDVLYSYTMEGKFIAKYGKKGKGPLELEGRISSWDVHSGNGEVYAVSGNRLIVFNTMLEPKKEYPIEEGRSYTMCIAMDGKIILYTPAENEPINERYGISKFYSLNLENGDLSLISEKRLSTPTPFLINLPRVYTLEDRYIIKYAFVDTVFRTKDFKDFEPIHYIKSEEVEKGEYPGLQLTDHYLFMLYDKLPNSYILIQDRNTGEVRTTNNYINIKEKAGYRGLAVSATCDRFRFDGRNYFKDDNGDEYLIDVVMALEFLDKIGGCDGSDFMGLDLDELKSDIDESDNPILLFGKVK